MYSPAKLYACKFAEDGSMAKAIHWHTKAVEKGHSYSAYELGKIYLIGENNKLDLKKSYRYYYQASNLDNSKSKMFVKTVAKLISASTKTQIEKQVKELLKPAK